jgi:hypothetical protein
MKKSWIPRAALAALVLMSISSLTFADIPNPNTLNGKKPQNSELTMQMQIATDEKAKEARLIIPRGVWQQMKAELDGTDSQTAGVTRFLDMSGAQTIMSGIFLSLAFAFGGVWLVRSRGNPKPRAAALGVAVLLAGITATGVAYANAGPPPVARSLTSRILIPELQWWGAYGKVKVEVSEEGREIRLVLPRRKATDKDKEENE